jgi:hypothetical protein
MTLVQDIEAKLADLEGSNYPQVRDALRDAMLLLAAHLQRHDELVAVQWEYDGGVDARVMPDDRMEALCQRMHALRAEIAGEAGEVIAAEEEDERRRMDETRKAVPETTIVDALAALREGWVGWAPELEPWFNAVEEMAACMTREQLAYVLGTRARFVPQAELDVAQERIVELERFNVGLANESHWYQQRLDAAQERIKELGADAELGKAIREFPALAAAIRGKTWRWVE